MTDSRGASSVSRDATSTYSLVMPVRRAPDRLVAATTTGGARLCGVVRAILRAGSVGVHAGGPNRVVPEGEWQCTAPVMSGGTSTRAT